MEKRTADEWPFVSATQVIRVLWFVAKFFALYGAIVVTPVAIGYLIAVDLVWTTRIMGVLAFLFLLELFPASGPKTTTWMGLHYRHARDKIAFTFGLIAFLAVAGMGDRVPVLPVWTIFVWLTLGLACGAIVFAVIATAEFRRETFHFRKRVAGG